MIRKYNLHALIKQGIDMQHIPQDFYLLSLRNSNLFLLKDTYSSNFN